MSKNYIIFYNNNNMIFPVKAEFNPHVHGNVAAYCAGSPQFFGGTQEGDESVLTVLGREVAEESINTYSIQPGYATLFYEQRVLNRNNNRNTPYEFYCTRSYAATGQQWPQSAQNWGLLAANSREMCWVATVPMQTFQNINQNATDYDIAALLFTAQAQGAPQWAQQQMEQYPGEEFMESATSEAFAAFVRMWTQNQLP